MIWASSGLTSYLLRTNTYEPDKFESSDHSIFLATFDLHTQIRPANQAELAAQRPKDKKLLPEDADNEAWESFAEQIERCLGTYGRLDNVPQFPATFLAGVAMDPFSENDLRDFPLNAAWELLRDAIMSSAFAHLPSARTGGRPPPPEGERLLLTKIHEIGGIIWSARVTFIEQQLAEGTTKEDVHGKIFDWHRTNGIQLGLSNVPDTEATTEDIINAHIENRDLRFQTHTRETIRGILDVTMGRVNLDHLIVDGDPINTNATGNVSPVTYVLDDPKEIKSRVRQYFCDTFHKARPTQPMSAEWEEAYQPRADIRPEWYDSVMAIPDYAEVCEAVAAAPLGKAPGHSKVSGDLLKRLGPLAQALFVVLRLTLVLSRHSIFHGPNFSVLKGTMTKDPIHILNAVLEDAREYKKEVWVLLQDMKRCFDSVSCQRGGMLELGLRHLKIPQSFIDLCLY
ncbi:hypothetical protein EC957_009809, partial [Mortierella hygrophila]